MNLLDLLIYGAGFVLAMIILANFLAPKKLGYGENLKKVDVFFGEVFRVHCGYIVLVMLGMLLACVLYTDDLRDGVGLGFGLSVFMAVFWGSRVVIHFRYYDRGIKQQYPAYNVIFVTAFAYLAVLFIFLTFRNIIS